MRITLCVQRSDGLPIGEEQERMINAALDDYNDDKGLDETVEDETLDEMERGMKMVFKIARYSFHGHQTLG